MYLNSDEMNALNKGFTKAVLSGEIIDLLQIASLPNIPTSTNGGHVFWKNLTECNGWRLQQNRITHHCRILDPQDVRRAWGGDEAMVKLFIKFNK